MKVGIVGCGTIAAFHLPAVLKHKNVSSVSVTDLDLQRANTTASQFKVGNVYTDLDVMLKEYQPDVVHILTPPATHTKLALRTIKSGAHVLVEKPMTLNLEETERLIQAADQQKVKLCVDHNYLFDPNVMAAIDLVQTGKAGKVLHVESHYSFDIGRYPGLSAGMQGSWILDLPGGVLTDSLAHPLSILLQFLPTPLNVHAVSKNNGVLLADMPDELRVLVDAVEATGFVSVSLGTRPDCFSVTIYATEMTIHINLSNMTLVTRPNRKVSKKLMRPLDSFDQSRQLVFSTVTNTLKVLTGKAQPPGDIGPLIDRFYTSIQNDIEVPVTGEDGRTIVKLMNEIWSQLNWV